MSGEAVVFTGPSLPAARVRAVVPHARVEPPASRGDLDRACAGGARTLLLIDGVFAHQLAVPPSEVVRALRTGVRVLGAASLGALRAAECRPAGAEGVGAVFWLYRLRIIADDDEVAVAVEPDRGHRAATVALINVRLAVLAALRRGWLPRAEAGAVLSAAKRLHFSERVWPAIFTGAGVEAGAELRALCETTDVKRRDAERALTQLATTPAHSPVLSAPGQAPGFAAVAARYPGHDPLLGLGADEARVGLVRWLLESGRYRRFCPEHTLTDPPEALWEAVLSAGELDGELLRWYAVREGAELAQAGDGTVTGEARLAAQAAVAQEHGYIEWAQLETAGEAAGAAVAGAREAAEALARARLALGSCTAFPGNGESNYT